jgi:glycerol uptake facilitator-like aquaporin
MKFSLARRLCAEFLGTAFLLMAVVGSGIMGQLLSGGNVAIALLANSIAMGAALVALIFTFGPISGAHFNPVVSIGDTFSGGISGADVLPYCLAQVSGGIAGTISAHLMFGLPVIAVSHHARSGLPQFYAEIIATFGLIAVISACVKLNPTGIPLAVGTYIGGAYWFTSSTSFANPAVTIARCFSDTFAGIRPQDAPGFLLAEILGTAIAILLFRWLIPAPLAVERLSAESDASP